MRFLLPILLVFLAIGISSALLDKALIIRSSDKLVDEEGASSTSKLAGDIGLVPKSYENGLELSAPELKAISDEEQHPAIEQSVAISDDIVEARCAKSQSLLLPMGLADIPDHLPPFNYGYGVSDDALLERIRQGDGYAEQVYGNTLLVRLVNGHFDAFGFVDREEQAEQWLRKFDETAEVLRSAVRKRSGGSAANLGLAFSLRTPRYDPVRSTAWYLIHERMGGTTRERLSNRGIFGLTAAELDTSELMASSLIEEHGLWFLDQSVDSESGHIGYRDCVEN